MNELFESFTTNELFIGGGIGLAVFITCAYICWRIIYHLFCFVDDKKAEGGDENSWLLATIGAWFLCFLLIVVLLGLKLVWLNIVAPILNYLPIDVYVWVVSIAVSIYIMRYIRRTHKAIHGHVNNPEAHTEKEKKAEYMKPLCDEERMWRRIRDNHIRDNHFFN